ncbi:hypothetical protein D3C76_1292510 [compost metagenome]
MHVQHPMLWTSPFKVCILTGSLYSCFPVGDQYFVLTYRDELCVFKSIRSIFDFNASIHTPRDVSLMKQFRKWVRAAFSAICLGFDIHSPPLMLIMIIIIIIVSECEFSHKQNCLFDMDYFVIFNI